MGLQPLRDRTSRGYKVWSHFEIFFFLLLTRWNTHLQRGAQPPSCGDELWVIAIGGAIKLKVRLTFTFFMSGADMAADQAPTRRYANQKRSQRWNRCLPLIIRSVADRGHNDLQLYWWWWWWGDGLGFFFFLFSAQTYPVGLTQLLLHQEFPSSETPAIVS